MKRVLFGFLALFLIAASSSEETGKKTKKTCTQSNQASRDATVLSVMGWGIAIFAGIAALTALVSDNPADNTTSTTSQ